MTGRKPREILTGEIYHVGERIDNRVVGMEGRIFDAEDTLWVVSGPFSLLPRDAYFSVGIYDISSGEPRSMAHCLDCFPVISGRDPDFQAYVDFMRQQGGEAA